MWVGMGRCSIPPFNHRDVLLGALQETSQHGRLARGFANLGRPQANAQCWDVCFVSMDSSSTDRIAGALTASDLCQSLHLHFFENRNLAFAEQGSSDRSTI